MKRAAWLITAVFVLALILIISLADLGQMPAFITWLYAYPGGDKLGHFILMGLLSALLNLSLGCRRLHLGQFSVLVGSLAAALVVTLEEISQTAFASRSFSLVDLGFSWLGSWVFGLITEAFWNKGK